MNDIALNKLEIKYELPKIEYNLAQLNSEVERCRQERRRQRQVHTPHRGAARGQDCQLTAHKAKCGCVVETHPHFIVPSWAGQPHSWLSARESVMSSIDSSRRSRGWLPAISIKAPAAVTAPSTKIAMKLLSGA